LEKQRNIYIVDEIPVLSIKPRDYNNEQSRYYHPSTYTIDFTSGAVISAVEYARIYYDVNPKTLEVEEKYAYYDIECTKRGSNDQSKSCCL